MITSSTVITEGSVLRDEVTSARRRGLSVGFVPTMGALHAGHEALIARSAAAHDLTVVSIFVNPTQFNDPADLAAYPRSEEADIARATAAGAGICFVPGVEEMYPDGQAPTVRIRGPLTETLEGAGRGSAHFDGVCTVLSVLFSVASPDVAYFGAKDAQQLQVVRRMVADLRLPLRIEAVETVRDSEGLALSSRNERLAPADRAAALSLSRSLATVGRAILDGAAADAAAASEMGLHLLRQAGCEPEYFAAVDPESFEQDPAPGPSTLLLCAARVGEVRLIDNMTTQFAAQTGYGFDREREES